MSKTGGLAFDAMYGVVTAECRNCRGEGSLPVAGGMKNEPCTVCKGEGEIHCDTGGSPCPYDGYCYCEAAWDRQQEQYGEDAS